MAGETSLRTWKERDLRTGISLKVMNVYTCEIWIGARYLKRNEITTVLFDGCSLLNGVKLH